ncbi:hypothetical protein QO003_001466 [Arthrobacter silviterrae]|nr:hypothetical protein [Arthrobacter silviterrae]
MGILSRGWRFGRRSDWQLGPAVGPELGRVTRS